MLFGQSPMRKWTVSVDYQARDDSGKPFRARSVIQVEAEDIAGAYAEAERSKPDGGKLGTILPGWHIKV